MIALALILMIVVISLGFDLWFPGLPWFTPFIVAFIAGLFAGRLKTKPFLIGFAGVGSFWALLLLIMHVRNDGILTEKMSALFTEQMGIHISPVVLIIITLLIGAILGGLSSLTGKLFSHPSDDSKRLRRRRKKRSGSYKLKI